MSRRTERVASVVRRVVAEALQRGELADPRIERFISITRVEVADDLALAKIFVSVMHDQPARRRLSVEALESAAGRLRALLRPELATRITPALTFRLDESVRRSMDTITAIDQAMQEYAPAEPAEEQDGDDAGAAAPPDQTALDSDPAAPADTPLRDTEATGR